MSAKQRVRRSAALGAMICERLAGGESLRRICGDAGMPSLASVYRWLQADETFRTQYVIAREHQADALFDEILDIADDGTNDFVEKESKTGLRTIVLREEAISRSRLRVEARKWMIARLAPKKYGEKHEPKGDSSDTLLDFLDGIRAAGERREGAE